jgi:hypothetical protein
MKKANCIVCGKKFKWAFKDGTADGILDGVCFESNGSYGSRVFDWADLPVTSGASPEARNEGSYSRMLIYVCDPCLLRANVVLEGEVTQPLKRFHTSVRFGAYRKKK